MNGIEPIVERSFGCSREVFLVGRFAIKVPTWRRSWLNFLNGFISNLGERRFQHTEIPCIAKVVWSDPLGLIVVMERCSQPRNFTEHHLRKLIELGRFEGADYRFSDDLHVGNVGFVGRRLVLLDYG
jgi:hypothetical protein